MPSTRFPAGKLPAEFLGRLLERYAAPDPRLLVGPGIGRDAAVIRVGDQCLIAKTDPVTFATDEIGWYAVHVNANDIVCCGGIPRWFLATILLPDGGATRSLVEAIFRQISDACGQVGATLCGGHTEITHDLRRPIVVGQMLGEVPAGGYLEPGGARVGDRIILTKGIAIEGTALIARERPDELASALSPEEVQRSGRLLHAPGISVVAEARLAMEAGGVHAMHDPTEGGLATGLWELAEAAGLGLSIEAERILVLPECARICRLYGLDPLGLIASGALLIAADPGSCPAILAQLQSHQIAAAVIGEVTPAGEGCMLREPGGVSRPLPRFARDEIARLFEPARPVDASSPAAQFSSKCQATKISGADPEN